MNGFAISDRSYIWNHFMETFTGLSFKIGVISIKWRNDFFLQIRCSNRNSCFSIVIDAFYTLKIYCYIIIKVFVGPAVKIFVPIRGRSWAEAPPEIFLREPKFSIKLKIWKSNKNFQSYLEKPKWPVEDQVWFFTDHKSSLHPKDQILKPLMQR